MKILPQFFFKFLPVFRVPAAIPCILIREGRVHGQGLSASIGKKKDEFPLACKIMG
jgi:hypothetical protein